jgi:hypothetical protein
MINLSPPQLNLDYACITTKANALISSLVSSYFNKSNAYFMVFTFPEINAHRISPDIGEEDDRFAKTMGTQAAIRISNTFARVHPSKIFLASMSEAQKSYIRAHIPDRYLIAVETEADVQKIMEEVPHGGDGVFTCRRSEITQGLAAAKFTGKLLQVDESSPSVSLKFMRQSKGLVVIENEGTSDQVVAVNYAASIGADIVFVRPFARTDLHPLQKLIYEWKNAKSNLAYQALRQKLIERTDGINFLDYEYATFFTLGFPYGMLLNNIIPFTHVLSHPCSDLFVVNNIGTELFSRTSGSAVIFSPKRFKQEETEELIDLLTQNKYVVRALLGKSATVNALSYYLSYARNLARSGRS